MTDVPDPQPTPAPQPPVPAVPPTMPTTPPLQPAGAPPPPPSIVDVLPAYAPPPPEPPKRGGRGKLVGVAVAVVVALVAGVFAVNALSSSSDGGASSPEEAVKKLFEAVADEDAIGVLDTLDPGERDILLPTITGANDQLARLGIVKDVDLGKVPGFDIQVTGLETKTEDLFDGVAKVTITGGSISISTRPDAVPTGDVLRDLIETTGGDASVPESSDEAALGGGDGDYIVAVKGDGGWYLSIAFSIAEQARIDSGLDQPDPAQAIAPAGSQSAEEAVTAFLNAIGQLDLRSLIAHMPPSEARALQLYAPLFLGDAQQSADDVASSSGFSLAFSNLDLSTSEGELGTIVKINGGTVTASLDDGSISLTVRDGCVSFDAAGDAASVMSDLAGEAGSDNEICQDELQSSLSDQLSDFSDSDGGPFAAFGELGTRLQKAELGLVAVKDDGGWYVSPTRTILELLLQVLKTFDKADFAEGGLVYDLLAGG